MSDQTFEWQVTCEECGAEAIFYSWIENTAAAWANEHECRRSGAPTRGSLVVVHGPSISSSVRQHGKIWA